MRAILVSVDYSDLLAVSLPWNRHHFREVWVITSEADYPNVQPICQANDAKCLATDLFFAQNAVFNKWAALEWGLDQMGRSGWICLMDADVLWPKVTKLRLASHRDCEGGDDCWCGGGIGYPAVMPGCFSVHVGQLCSPLRRMFTDLTQPIPPEPKWKDYPIHRNVTEWAGYSQCFHASDPVLGSPPWHEVDWQHAGGADSFFQAKWHPSNKIRPPFEVLHLGCAGVNWMGRTSAYLDGTRPAEADSRLSRVAGIWRGRRGKSGADRFKHEKL